MAKQQEIKSIISVYGRTDGSLDRLGRKIESFGDKVQKIGNNMTLLSAPMLAAEKASMDLYSGYDDTMRKVQAAGDYANKELDILSAAARKAGADTRFMATDAAEGILYMTQAGVSLNGTLEVLPSLLNEAAAGDMELSKASDLLISNIYSLGKEFNKTDTTKYIDQVTTAADATNTTLEEMMLGVSKVGAAGRLFGGGTEELLAFLGLLSNLNLKGTTGGINARNMIISLLAPTNKATEVMEALAISEEEAGEALEDINLADSAALMEKLGLETVDASGKVRPMINILADLKKATDGMADDEKAQVLYTMFAKRTYPAVAGLFDLLDDYPELLEKIENSEGAAAKKAAILEGGIGGTSRRLRSAIEELGLSIGEATDDKVIEWMDSLREMALDAADFIKELDPEKVNAIMDGLLRFALIGPSLAIGGKAFETIGSIMRTLAMPGGPLITVGVAAGAATLGINQMMDAAARKEFENHFGAMEMNAEAVKSTLSGISGEYITLSDSMNGYATAVSSASTAYETAVSGLSGGILEAYLTQTELSETDKASLQAYAQDMIETVQGAIEQQKLQLSEFIDFQFDGENAGDEEKNAAWDQALSRVFGDLNLEAEQAGQNLMQTYYEAVADDTITEAEREAIARAQESLNRVMAEIQSYQGELEANALYEKSMDLSWGSAEEHFALIDEQFAKQNDVINQGMWMQLGNIQSYENRGLAIPKEIQEAYGLNGAQDYAGWREGTRQDAQDQKLDLKRQTALYDARLADSYYDQFFKGQAENGVDFTPFEEMARQVMAGEMSFAQAKMQADQYAKTIDPSKMGGLVNGVNSMMDLFSGTLPIEDVAALAEREKETLGRVSDDLANLMQDYLSIGLFKGNFFHENAYELEQTGGINPGFSTDAHGYLGVNEKGMQILMQPKAEESANDYIETAGGLLEGADLTLNVQTPDLLTGFSQQLMGMQMLADNTRINVNVSTSERKPLPHSWRGGQTVKKYADGGYADEASIFGEAGPEYAIPVKKDENTRTLLRMAAAASGFKPREVYPEEKRQESSGFSFTYAPVIHASDSEGVQDALLKNRGDLMQILDRWYDEKKREEERVSYS